MIIKLDAREVINLVTDWARKQHKTKNVSATFDLSKPNDVSVDVSVMLSDIDMDTFHSSTADNFARTLATKLQSGNDITIDIPDIDLDLPCDDTVI